MKPASPAQQLDALMIKQLLQSSGVFKGSDAAGSSLHADMFAEALADAVAQSGEMKLNTMPAPVPAESSRGPGHVTSGFGARIDPITHQPSMHGGVDLAGKEGSPIVAAQGGVVKRAGERGGYGNAVEIDHGGGVTTLYAHASALTVKEGDVVQPGQTIAKVGHTGRSTGDHLHFELRVNGKQVDPMRALKSYRLRADEISEEIP